MAEDGTSDFHVDTVKGAHDSLDPRLVDLKHEGTDGLLSLRARRVGGDGGRRRPRVGNAAGGRGRGRLVQEHELDVAARQEAGYVIVEEAVDAFEIPDMARVNVSDPREKRRGREGVR